MGVYFNGEEVGNTVRSSVTNVSWGDILGDIDSQTDLNEIFAKKTELPKPNLLMNADFRINQRGGNSYTENGKYTVDRWINYNGATVTPVSNGVKILGTRTVAGTPYSGIRQFIEDSSGLTGKVVSFSISVDGIVYSATTTLTEQTAEILFINGFGNVDCEYSQSHDLYALSIYDTDSKNPDHTGHTINWVKLEFGSTPTEFTPRLLAEELLLCQRYFLPLLFRTRAVSYNSGVGMAFIIPTTQTLRNEPTLNLFSDSSQNKYSGIANISGVLEPADDDYTFHVTLLANSVMLTVTSATKPYIDCMCVFQRGSYLDAEIY